MVRLLVISCTAVGIVVIVGMVTTFFAEHQETRKEFSAAVRNARRMIRSHMTQLVEKPESRSHYIEKIEDEYVFPIWGRFLSTQKLSTRKELLSLFKARVIELEEYIVQTYYPDDNDEPVN